MVIGYCRYHREKDRTSTWFQTFERAAAAAAAAAGAPGRMQAVPVPRRGGGGGGAPSSRGEGGGGRAGHRQQQQRRPQHRQQQQHAPRERSSPSLAQQSFRFVLEVGSVCAQVRRRGLLERVQLRDVWTDTVCVRNPDVRSTCPFCLDSVRLGRALPCGHVFCGICVERCLLAGIFRCPICEGELSRHLLRYCETKWEQPDSLEFTNSFTLVVTTAAAAAAAAPPVAADSNTNPSAVFAEEDDRVPFLHSPDAFASKFVVASGEGMLRFVEREREDVKACRKECTMYRDAEGLAILADLERDLDDLYLRWNRLVGKTTVQAATAPTAVSGLGPGKTSSSVHWYYQRSDGAREFLHPVNLRCLFRNAGNEVANLPRVLENLPLVEIEDYSHRVDAVRRMLHVNSLPENSYCKVLEADLQGRVSEDALRFVAKECAERGRNRALRERKRMGLLQEERNAELERQARRLREKQDLQKQLDDFFGFDEARKIALAEMERQRRESPDFRPTGSFSAVVSGGGFFPALPNKAASSPKLAPSSSSFPPLVVLTPLAPRAASVPHDGNSNSEDEDSGVGFVRGGSSSSANTSTPQKSAWGSLASSSSASAYAGSSDAPAPSTTFAQATIKGAGGKKVALWSNNPGSRRGFS